MPAQLIRKVRDRQPQAVCRLADKYAKAFTVYSAATPGINLATGKNLTVIGNPLFGVAASGREVHGVYSTQGHLQVRSGINASVENWPGVTVLFHGVLTTFAAGTYPGLISIVPDTNYYNGIVTLQTEPTNYVTFYIGASSTPITKQYTTDFIGVPVTVIATYDVASATRSIHIYANGKYLTNSGSISTTWPNTSSLENIGGYNRSGTYRSSPHAISLSCVFPFSMGNAEILNLLKNPWQIFESETIPLFYSTVTVQLLSPTGDVAGGAWLPSTGTDLFACVDESAASDADYIYATTPGAYQEFTFQDGGAVDPSTGGHVRYRIPAGTGTIVAVLKQGTTTLQTLGTHTLTGSAQDIDVTITTSTANSTDLRVGFTAS